MFRSAILALAIVIGSVIPAYAEDVEHAPAPRGAVLPSLYVSLAALNAFDAYSTTRAVHGGLAVEANPLMRGAVNSSAAMWTIKGGVTAGAVLISERLWRNQHRAQAIAVMLVSNGLMSAIAVHNAGVLKR